jgi:SAM-dependent methyltransferase
MDDLVVRAWDEAAEGYGRYFEPRFQPWIADAVTALCEAAPPSGTIAVPGCGSGLDLRLLAESMPAHPVVGIDPAPGMCRLARARTVDLPRVTVRCEDGTCTDSFPQPCTAILSCFALQLLPDPPGALARWMRTLAPGGILCVQFWPDTTESRGPFADVRRVLETRLPARGRSWETRITDTLTIAGGRILRDATVRHPMHHEDARTFWDAMIRSGPLRTLLLARGDAFVAEARRAYLAVSPMGALEHEPQARLLVARRS